MDFERIKTALLKFADIVDNANTIDELLVVKQEMEETIALNSPYAENSGVLEKDVAMQQNTQEMLDMLYTKLMEKLPAMGYSDYLMQEQVAMSNESFPFIKVASIEELLSK